jgi:flagellar hook assembly protein FlgD
MRRTLFLELVASFTPAGAQAGQSQLVGSQPTGRFALLPSLPNPFERTTAIRLEVPRASEVRVEVFDALGRRVRTLANQVFPPGVHSLEWDGSDARGVRMGPGVYVVRMMSDGFRQEQRVVWLGN